MKHLAYFLIVCFSLVFQPIFSQKFSFGVHLGWTTGQSKVKTNKSQSTFENVGWDQSTGLTAGLKGQIHLSKHFIFTSGIEYYPRLMQGQKMVSFAGDLIVSGRTHHISVPIMLGYMSDLDKKIYWFANGGAGASIPITREIKTATYSGQPMNLRINTGSADLNFEMGGGLRLNNRMRLEAILRFQGSQFVTSWGFNGAGSRSEWYTSRWNPMIGLVFN